MIIPAILEKEWSEIENKLEICRGFANTIHVDFIDGKFVNNTSFLETAPFKKYADYFTLEAHLMVEEPINYLEKLSEAGFKRFIGHIEKMTDQVEFVARGEELGVVGLGVDLLTPLSSITVSLEDLDQILLMSVNAGFSGQMFNSDVIEKIEDLKGRGFTNIEIDGGINKETLSVAKKAGANMFCATSFLFKGEPKKQFELLSAL